MYTFLEDDGCVNLLIHWHAIKRAPGLTSVVAACYALRTPLGANAMQKVQDVRPCNVM